MPLYEYHCRKCGKTFEVIQKFSDHPLTMHDDCGGQVERLLSAPAIQFKGTGWYVTDYGKNGSSGSSPRKERKGEGKSDSGGESKSAISNPSSAHPAK